MTFGSTSTSDNPLPITLIEFEGALKEDENAVKLNWSTASETNNDYFLIQRTEGQSFSDAAPNEVEWRNIGRKEGYGDSYIKRDYSFIDEEPHHGDNFYRLKQVDKDGTYEYHEIINVNTLEDPDLSGQSSLSVHPNPLSGDKLEITFNNILDQEAEVEILNLKGRVIKSEKLEIGLGSEVTKPLRLDHSLDPGVYSVRVSTDKENLSKNLIVR